MTTCLARDCPGTVDQDGFCLKWGHQCRGLTGDSGGPDPGGSDPAPGGSGPDTGDTGSSGGTGSGGPGTGATSSRPAGPGTLAGAGGGIGSGVQVATRLWFGLVRMPVVPPRDPMTAIRADHAVPEPARLCGKSTCRRPVGRTEGTDAGLAEGFCPRCGTPFSFVPPLHEGDVIKQRYVIQGCIGYGGMGWIFAARDEDMDGSWRVLKRQRAAEDAASAEAFVGERKALIALDHPNIVKIYDFVRPDAADGTPYIVMEFVGGRSLDEMRPRPTGWGVSGPLPLDQVLGYGMAILDAFEHLHEQGWLYCDLKPDNVMHVGHRLKLLDLGAARRAGDLDSPMLGTRGFEAPEIRAQGARAASVRSDLYTVGRTLAALSLAANTGQFVSRFPDGQFLETPPQLLVEHESYRRLLVRATDPDPDRRFDSAATMRAQVRGVLRQVLAERGTEPPPEASPLFGLTPRPFGAHEDLTEPVPAATIATTLPAPLVDLADPGAGFLGSIGAVRPAELIALLGRAPERTRDVLLRLVRAHLEAGHPEAAAETLAEATARGHGDDRDWRLNWHRGLVALASDEIATARAEFDTVYGLVPGELAARLGLAAATELAGDTATAARHYGAVWATDRSSISAVFGLARTRLSQGDRRGATAALDQVPETASHRVPAQIAKVRVLLSAEPTAGTSEAELVDAAATVEGLPVTGSTRDALTAEVLEAALTWRLPRQRGSAGRVFGVALDESALRLRLERAYRSLARQSMRRRDRVALVDRANAVRPWTWT
ncbi:serine/threonine-protein kinase [Micromonospora polyrhachis]|uniref:non-specific serine/threonine protein kinase n=1 Tax=Micromonospora polyrhachis TaxID=1282883 RepID=A0A7W7WSC6_9ACTN|nr:serine/threonine-protein kinase [Micromonospora polyrhachis]MBB4961985.1 serine/threonine-protein kinase PknG [Micromonospora polyrhachis]